MINIPVYMLGCILKLGHFVLVLTKVLITYRNNSQNTKLNFFRHSLNDPCAYFLLYNIFQINAQ